jgi:Peptidase family M23
VVFRTDNRGGRWAALAAIVWALLAPSSAAAWSWPVSGPVLKPFHVDRDPYGAGQHRGIEIAAAPREDVLAPVAGVVAFAGTVPGGGRTITLRTEDGYSVTLLHLGSLAVRAGTPVAEQDVVAAAELSGDEWGVPSVYLGVRLTAEPHGYLDPLALLPPRQSRAAGPAPGPEPGPAEPAGAAAQQAQPPARAAAGPAVAPRTAPRPSTHVRLSRTRPAPPPAVTTRSRVTEAARPVQRTRTPVARPAGRTVRAQVPASRQWKAPTAKRSPVRSAPASIATQTRPAAPGRRVTRPTAREHDRSRAWLFGLALAGFALCAIGVVGRLRAEPIPVRGELGENALRKMSEPPVDSEESLAEQHPAVDSRRRRVAVCERSAAHRPCRRVRRPFGRLRALSPAARESRPHGQWDRRARNAGDGRGRQRGTVAS